MLNVSQNSVIDLGTNAEIKRLRSLFGDAQLSWKSPEDPEIPACLRPGAHRPLDEAVLTVRCANGLAALVATHEGVHDLVTRNPVVREGLLSLWESGFIFWVRVNAAVASGNSLAQRGVELVQSGLIPVAVDPQQVRTLIHHAGPLLALESLDLGVTIGSGTGRTDAPSTSVAQENRALPGAAPIPSGDGGVREAQIPGRLAAALRAIFGAVTMRLVSSLDPNIPPRFNWAGSGQAQAVNVVALSCEQGLGAVISGPDQLGQVEALYPVLRQSPLSLWQGYFVHWIRCELGVEEKKSLGPDQSVGLGAGAFLILQGLIPVAIDRADGEVLVVRHGTVPKVALAELVRERKDSGSGGPAGGTPPATPDPVGAGTETEDPPSPDTAAEPGERLKELRAVFGKDRVLEDIHGDDPRIPSGLAAAGGTDPEPADSDLWAIRCGLHATGHLVAVVFHEPLAAQSFFDENPGLNSIGTAWGPFGVLWFRVQGPVPRNLRAGPLTWTSEGIIPVSSQAGAVFTAMKPAEPIPLTRFDEIKWDEEVVRAFEADEVQQLHGGPFLPVQPRTFVLNGLFLGRMLLRQLDLAYDRVLESFRRYHAATLTWATLSRPEVFRLVAERLIQLAHDFPNQLSPADVSQSTVRRLVWLMEIQGAVDIPTETQVAEQFFNEAIEPCAGAVLIQDALYKGLLTYCKARGFPLCSKAYFDRAATKRFGKTSHCFGESGAARGRVGWRLRPDVISRPAGQHQGHADKPGGPTSASNA